MIRVARFELDPSREAARRFLAEAALVPRSRRERWLLRLLDLGGAPARRLPPGLWAAPGDCAASPSHGDCFAAAEALLDGALGTLTGGLDLLPAPHSPRPVRLLFLWRAGERAPAALAKATRLEHAPRLEAEASALEALSEPPSPLDGLVPRVLCRGDHGGLAVLVQSCRPGRSLARHLALRRRGAWPAAGFARLGDELGSLHAAGREHGDAWSRNVLVDRRGRPTGWVDWECSVPCRSPAAEALRFLLSTARSDLSARSRSWGLRAADDEALAAWTFGAGAPGRAARAFLARWAERLGRDGLGLAEALSAEPERLGLRGPPSARTAAFLREVLAREATG